MKEWFNFRFIADANERTLGVMLRLFGIDLSVLMFGWVNEWRLIDLRIPVNYGVYLQLLFITGALGRIPTSVYYETENVND